MVSLIKTAVVKAHIAALKEVGCTVELDIKDRGIATAHDGETKVFSAIQKGRGGPWIARYTESANIRWQEPEVTKPTEATNGRNEQVRP